jgi:hypothetical protein
MGAEKLGQAEVEVDVFKLPSTAKVNHRLASRYLEIKERTLYNKLYTGEGPRSTVRFGKREYLIADLAAYKKANTKVFEAYE